MMFLGNFLSGVHSMDATPAKMNTITNLKIMDGLIDEVSATQTLVTTFTDWDYDTLFHATFKNGSLLAGNVDYSASTVSAMKVKQRRVGEYEWHTCFVIPIADDEDFTFERFYRYAAANQEYEFALVPVIGDDAEGNYSINRVKSDFDGYFFVEKDQAVSTMLNTTLSLERVQQTAVVMPFRRKYPIVVKNGDVNYTSGTLTATFMEYDPLTCTWKSESAWKYREQVIDFLTNGNTKIYKDFEGRLKMVSIIDAIPQTENGHYQNMECTINFVEIGDPETVTDMYVNGFIDFDRE